MRKDIKAAVKTSRQTPKLRTAGQEEGHTPAWGRISPRGLLRPHCQDGRESCWSAPPHTHLGKLGPPKAPGSPPPDFPEPLPSREEGEEGPKCIHLFGW